jgi:hypothetical protein
MPWGLIVAGVFVLVPLGIIAVNLRQHAGEAAGPFEDRVAIVEVALDEAAASELCKRAALEVAGTRTFATPKRSRLKVNSHLEGEGGNSQLLDFRFSRVDDGRTRIEVIAPMTGQPGSYLSGIRVSVTRKRRALLDRVAQWLADQGDGKVLELRWGRP